jgi:hypothetical protein
VTLHPQTRAHRTAPVGGVVQSSPGPMTQNPGMTRLFAQSSTIHTLYYYD